MLTQTSYKEPFEAAAEVAEAMNRAGPGEER
jgi:hypothetical protein